MNIVNNDTYKNAKTQLVVINALVIREVITRYGRHNLGVLWLIMEPMLFTLGVTAFWYLSNLNHYSRVPIVTFAITGYSTVLLWRNTANRSAKAIEPNRSLLHHSRVKVIDFFLARIALEVIGATGSFLFIFLSFYLLGIVEAPKDPFKVITYWYLLILLSLGLGLCIGAISEISETFDRIWHIATYLLFPLTGVGFMVGWLPDRAKEIVLIVPMVHATEGIRSGFFGTNIKTYENATYLICSSIILIAVGFILAKKASKLVTLE